jgi:hypothetical protein
MTKRKRASFNAAELNLIVTAIRALTRRRTSPELLAQTDKILDKIRAATTLDD